MVLKDRLVALVGGGGFVGRYAAQALMRAGARVRIAQRDPRQAWFLKPLGAIGQSQFVAADVARPDTIARALQGCDAAVNLVGVLAGDFERVHVAGARAVAEAAAAAGLEALVQVSAIGAAADAPSAYARSKAAGEAAARVAFPDTVVLRPSVVFGREDQFVNRFAGMVARFPVVPVLRAPVRFQPVFVGDVADAIAAALARSGELAGRTLELGGPDVVSMGRLLRWIADAIGRSPSFVDLPDAAGALLSRLPGGPLTADQWRSLQVDNVVTGEDGLATLGVAPTAMAAVAPEWLVRFRRAGRFGARAAVAG
jgi:uncharacterized protein YbjT (DUF2867 family)